MISQSFRISRLARFTAWLLLLCFLTSLAAPALEAQTSAKATLSDDSGDDSGSSDSEAAAASEDSDDDDDGDDDSLFSLVPRSDRTDFNRTIGALLGGLAVGVLGLSFGPIGFMLGGALGAGLGYLISRELWPDHYSVNAEDYGNRSSSYDAYYGYGSNTYPIRAQGFKTPPDTPLRELEEDYFAALENYRRALRSTDFQETSAARAEYQQAYEALVRGKAGAR